MTEPASTGKPRWRPPGPPANEVPRSAPVHAVLGRGKDAVLFITEAQAYSTGVVLSMGLRLRRPIDSHLPNVQSELLGLPTRNAAAAAPEERLMMGVQFSDGQRAVMTAGFLPPHHQTDTAADAVSLVSVLDGSFGELNSDVRYWPTPLPPAGPLRFILRWQAMDIEETVTELDGSVISAAGASATVLWPLTSSDDTRPLPAPPATSGWFAQAR